MFTLSNVIVVPPVMLMVGSNVMVKAPITGSTGAGGAPGSTGAPRKGKKGGKSLKGKKSLAVKLMVSVIVVAFAGLAAPVDASANAPANANALKVILFMTRSQVITPRAETHDAAATKASAPIPPRVLFERG
jgi:hypothetical protein